MIQERGCGQFLQVCEAKALQERFGCRKAQATVATRELFYEVQIPKLHNESTLVGVEESVDFCLADRLPKGDEGEHFERGGREIRNSVRFVLFAQVAGQGLVVDFGNKKRNPLIMRAEDRPGRVAGYGRKAP